MGNKKVHSRGKKGGGKGNEEGSWTEGHKEGKLEKLKIKYEKRGKKMTAGSQEGKKETEKGAKKT